VGLTMATKGFHDFVPLTRKPRVPPEPRVVPRNATRPSAKHCPGSFLLEKSSRSDVPSVISGFHHWGRQSVADMRGHQ